MFICYRRLRPRASSVSQTPSRDHQRGLWLFGERQRYHPANRDENVPQFQLARRVNGLSLAIQPRQGNIVAGGG